MYLYISDMYAFYRWRYFMKKKIFVLVATLLMVLSTIVIAPSDYKVEAAGGRGYGNGGDNTIGLDKDYMYNITLDLANVVHEAYTGNEIRKGRYFGSKGDQWTANYLYNEIIKCNI